MFIEQRKDTLSVRELKVLSLDDELCLATFTEQQDHRQCSEIQANDVTSKGCLVKDV